MFFRFVAVLVLVVLLAPANAQAAKRIALLIGNADYGREVGPLLNPINDVKLIAAALRTIGFADGDIRIVKNGTRRAILGAINRHAEALKAAGPGAIGFLYYSGHGMANKRTHRNYLIPVGVGRLDRTVWYDAVPLDTIVSTLSDLAPNAAHFVIFDACRSLLNMPIKGSKGFVPVLAKRGMLIAFSTDPGETASDEGVGGGPYARVLAEQLVKPGIHHLDLFQNVKEQVYHRTRVQVPWERNGLLERIYLAGRVVDPPRTGKPRPPMSDAAVAWRIVEKSSDCVIVRVFAEEYPNTVWSRFAQVRMSTLACEQKTSAATRKRSRPVPSSSDCDGVDVRLASGGTVCVKPGSGKSFKDCPTCPEMVVAPVGEFTMGSPESEPERSLDEVQVHVSIARPFAVGKFAVTFAEWDACVANGGCSHEPGDNGWGRGKRPVTNVSWNDITEQYLPWLSRKTGETYRLLSEAEWEYVARAGTTTSFWWGSSISPKQANYNGNYVYKRRGSKGENRRRTVSVDNFKANPWGLYNVHGNVWEWTQDCANDSNAKNPGDGSARTTGDCSRTVLRGGSWNSKPEVLRSAYRDIDSIHNRDSVSGFRVVRTLTP
jgi:formylglycine-generating enzyme required for sulfatase activity